MKIEYSQSTWLIKAYYYDWWRTQLWTDETYILGTPKFILKGLKSWVSQSFYGSRVDNFYYVTWTYSAQYPWVGWWSWFIYLSSWLFYDRLLSYTNAWLSYKTKDPLILKNNYSIGSKALVWFDWINSDQSEMTPWATQYLSDTAWEISETAGTNKYQIWQAITDESMKYDIANLKTETPTVWASPYTYQNIETNEQKVMITWWTVSVVQYSRDWSTFYTQWTSTNTEVILWPWDYVKTTYSSIPTFTIFNK